ncbi:class I tRNA ligase family protein, partial [Acinetobacter baumannii]|uniref:class I tRNA ligase family protein n=1 Tax=Acinetobacter baumannii TaxID=470 RepID=UPI0011138808
YKKIILPDGTIQETVPYIGGMKVKAARTHIAALLEQKGLLVKREEISHMTAVHERCGNNVEFIPSRQWYIDVLSEK